ncbi:hypothetical protein KIN20_030730 [Parelaphostrongylus tenuis]|uniref:Uncharacterized protein n=1 Tax=Parelaphostrongylus tenuis TaxID=148309 RepID=A0AAD5WGM0_PARTN|nr:hypothetical protein KIN20_030730 [Parelaphostrongylus tenuis]
MRTFFRWVHDYQDACICKAVRFIEGELNRTPSLSTAPSSTGPSNRQVIGARSQLYSQAFARPQRRAITGSVLVSEHPPSMPSITPASSTDRNRRKHHTSVTTVYDRS